jgi:hypothetical protein
MALAIAPPGFLVVKPSRLPASTSLRLGTAAARSRIFNGGNDPQKGPDGVVGFCGGG